MAGLIAGKTEARHATMFIQLDVDNPSRLAARAVCRPDFPSDAISFSSPIFADVEFKISARELLEGYDTIRSATQRSPSRRGSTALLDPVKDVGTRLFNGLFQGELGRAYRESVVWADERAARLRISILSTPNTLVEDLPWEFLYDPLRNDFLALSARRPIIRQAALPTRAHIPNSSDSIRIAFLATPDPKQQLESDRDWEILQHMASGDRGRVSITRLDSASAEVFLRTVTSDEYDIVHFSGHAIEERSGGGLSSQALVLSGPNGSGTELVSADMLSRASVGQRGPRLLYLNACNSHRLAQRFATHIPNVIGMRDLVSIDFCVTFANGLYRSILKGFSIEEAVAAAREVSDTVNPGGREWGMAVFCSSEQLPVYLTSFTPRFETQFGEEGASPVLSDPGHEREWKRLSQLLELNRRNFAALMEVHDSLIKSDGLGETVRKINQGSVPDVETQVSKLKQTIADIESRMNSLRER